MPNSINTNNPKTIIITACKPKTSTLWGLWAMACLTPLNSYPFYIFPSSSCMNHHSDAWSHFDALSCWVWALVTNHLMLGKCSLSYSLAMPCSVDFLNFFLFFYFHLLCSRVYPIVSAVFLNIWCNKVWMSSFSTKFGSKIESDNIWYSNVRFDDLGDNAKKLLSVLRCNSYLAQNA